MERIKQILDNRTVVAGKFIVMPREDAKYLYNNRKKVEKYMIENNIIEMDVYFPCIENQNNDFYMNLIQFYASGVHIFGFNDRYIDFYKLRSNNGYSCYGNIFQYYLYDILKSIPDVFPDIDKVKMINMIQTKNDVAKLILENSNIITLMKLSFLDNIYKLSKAIDDKAIYDECSLMIYKVNNYINNKLKTYK